MSSSELASSLTVCGSKSSSSSTTTSTYRGLPFGREDVLPFVAGPILFAILALGEELAVAFASSDTFLSGMTLALVGVERVGFDLPLEAKYADAVVTSPTGDVAFLC